MQIQKIHIHNLIPSEYNPRYMKESQSQKLSKNLQKFGLVDPIIINLQNNHIIGGHQRYNILIQQYGDKTEGSDKTLNLLKLGDIGWVFDETDLKIPDENHEKALNISLNRLSGEFDDLKLSQLLETLQEDHFDMELTGFEDYEILDYTTDDFNLDELLPEGNEFETDEDLIQETEKTEEPYIPLHDITTEIQKGDKYKLGNHTLMCGDSSSPEDIKELIQDTEINLILTDPPYGINLIPQGQKTVGGGGPLGFKEENTSTIGGGNIVKPREYKAIIGDDQPFNPEHIINLDKPTVLWGANNFSSHLPDNNQWIVWYKKPMDSKPNTFSDCELAWTNLPRNSIKLYHYLWSGLIREGNRDEELTERVHPTQKPVGLLKNIITDNLEEQDNNILDLYGGSGSTLIAAEATNNNSLLMELDPYYCQIIIDRWEEYTGQKAEKII